MSTISIFNSSCNFKVIINASHSYPPTQQHVQSRIFLQQHNSYIAVPFRPIASSWLIPIHIIWYRIWKLMPMALLFMLYRVLSRCKYNILIIARVQGGAENECNGPGTINFTVNVCPGNVSVGASCSEASYALRRNWARRHTVTA